MDITRPFTDDDQEVLKAATQRWDSLSNYQRSVLAPIYTRRKTHADRAPFVTRPEDRVITQVKIKLERTIANNRLKANPEIREKTKHYCALIRSQLNVA
ncbi:MAG: hypothetical protein RKH07_12595 [Gammaproteobacteria bacterium]